MKTEQNNLKQTMKVNSNNPIYLDDGSIVYRQKPASSGDIYLLYIIAFAVILAILFVVKFFFPGMSTAILVIIFIVLNIILEVLIMKNVKDYNFATLILTDVYLYTVKRLLVIFKKVKAIPWVEIELLEVKANNELKILLKNGNIVKINLQRFEDFDRETLSIELNSRI